MKRFEMTYDPATGKLTIRRESEESMTVQQRFILRLAAIGGAVWIAATCLVGLWGFFWGAVLAVFCIVRSYGKINF